MGLMTGVGKDTVFMDGRKGRCAAKRFFGRIAFAGMVFLFAFGGAGRAGCSLICYGEEQASMELYARSAVLMDGDSGRILYGKEEDAPMPMASTTKIMTCILALEYGEPELVCEVSSHAASQPQVKLQMVQGDSFYLRDLLYSLMLESHNDTAVCIAENVAGSVEGFAALMNQKAAELGCEDTYFITPNGLDAEDGAGVHHTTAAELARILRYCIRESPEAAEFLEITQTDTYSFSNVSGSRSYSCSNHNAFLHMMEGALTGKTGFTGNAGYCYVGALERDGKLLVVSLLACGWPNNKRYKWSDTRKLMEYGLEHYEKRKIGTDGLKLENIPVENGIRSSVEVEAEDISCELLLREDERVTRNIQIRESFTAPVVRGQEAGTVEYLIDGVPHISVRIVTSESSEEIDYAYCLEKVIGGFLFAGEERLF